MYISLKIAVELKQIYWESDIRDSFSVVLKFLQGIIYYIVSPKLPRQDRVASNTESPVQIKSGQQPPTGSAQS